MASNDEATIVGILDAWANGHDAAAEQVIAHFAPGCTWIQPGMPTTTGPDEAIALIKGFAAMDCAAIKVDVHNVASVGTTVFTERVDHVIMNDGSTSMSIPVVGVTEFEDGKIIAWREYFDSAALAAPA
jgi:limonene-1,2-epoxide hydrolase